MTVPYHKCVLVAAASLAIGLFAGGASARPLNLILPTSNQALLDGDGESFYQYTDRFFKGKKSYPWEGGQYGFVRNQKETRAGVVFTRFHEGLDIKPLYRDASGEPLDTVRAIDDGRVVYANRVARYSSYGKYVVVEHWWDNAPFYSLYAHLGDVNVQVGSRIRQGDALGRIGYTGTGITLRRAHLHFEINMLLNGEFNQWYGKYYRRSANRHDMYNGINLAGLDVADLYLSLQQNPSLSIDEFLSRQEVFFKVLIPNQQPLDMLFRYPWLSREPYDAAAPSLEVSFTQSGVPVQVAPSRVMVSEGTVSWVQPTDVAYDYISDHLLSGDHVRNCTLSGGGKRYMDMIMFSTRHVSELPPLPPVRRTAVQVKPPSLAGTPEVNEAEVLPLRKPERVAPSSNKPAVDSPAMPASPVKGW